MIKALIRVYYWCNKTKKHEFSRKEMKHLLKGSDNDIARWGDLVYFGGLVYKPQGKGTWGINLERCREFISGKSEIPTEIYKNPITKEITKDAYRKINQIKNLSEFLDENKNYICEYL